MGIINIFIISHELYTIVSIKITSLSMQMRYNIHKMRQLSSGFNLQQLYTGYYGEYQDIYLQNEIYIAK